MGIVTEWNWSDWDPLKTFLLGYCHFCILYYLSQILIIDAESDDVVSYLYQDSPFYYIDSIELFGNRNKCSFSVFS